MHFSIIPLLHSKAVITFIRWEVMSLSAEERQKGIQPLTKDNFP